MTRQHAGGPEEGQTSKLIMRWSTHNDNDTPDFKWNENRRSHQYRRYAEQVSQLLAEGRAK